MLKIKNLTAEVEGNVILKGLDFEVNPGEVHAIMGPNGAGKSTLAAVIAGHPNFKITSGSIEYNGKQLLEMEPEDRAREGVFLAFQYPIEIPGVSNANFMKSAINELRKYKGLDPLDSPSFLKMMREKAELVKLDKSFLSRSVNEGFSGGEKKRNEVFQMAMMDPELIFMDETDSGLDIDALKVVADGVNTIQDGKKAFVMITHYQRLLDYIVPDFVHVLADGKIVRSGPKELAQELEKTGYDWIH